MKKPPKKPAKKTAPKAATTKGGKMPMGKNLMAGMSQMKPAKKGIMGF